MLLILGPELLTTLVTVITSAFFVSSLWFINKKRLHRKGDVQRSSTYAYGSVRTYPVPTYWQKTEEYLVFLWLAITIWWDDGCRFPSFPLAGENFIHSVRKLLDRSLL